MKKDKSDFSVKKVFYVNYFPYDNSGKILDYLRENNKYVFLFLAGFYKIGNKKKINKLAIYKDGILEKETPFYEFSISQKLLFFLLPLKSILTFVQIFWAFASVYIRYGKIDIYFTVNAFPATIGILLKKVGLVKNTLFWVWDYYPFNHEKKIVVLMRRVYWQFDKFATLFSDNTFFLHKRMILPRKRENIIPKLGIYKVVPIATGEANFNSNMKVHDKKIKIGFIGVLKKSQGLDIIFDNQEVIHKNFPNISFEIIGSGPEELYFKRRAKNSPLSVKFYGYVEESQFEKILKNCHIGIAPYMPEPGTVSFYTDPGKPKRYINFGLPVITTNIIEFSNVIKKHKAGIVIDYYSSIQLVAAIKKIMSNYKKYQLNAVELNNKFYYKKIYPTMFNFE